MHTFEDMSADEGIMLNRQSSLPLHRQIEEFFEAQIKSGELKPGDMLPSTKALCNQLGGVNHLTVRRAVAALAAKGLLSAVKGKGTFVTDQGCLDRSTARGVIGIVCTSLADSLAHQIVSGVESVLRDSGYELILCNSNYSAATEAAHLKRLYASGVSGVLLVPFMPPANQELIEGMISNQKRAMPIVCIDRGYSGRQIPLVDVNNNQAAYEAVDYLISLGHRRIGFIVSSISWIDSIEPIKQRFLGYRKALGEHKIPFDQSLLQELGPTLASTRPLDVGLEHFGYQAMHKLLMLKDPPTAVFLLWDEIAPGALMAIQNSGLKVPEDLSLVGFNDDLLAPLLSVPLTTVRQPSGMIGTEAARLILRLIKGEEVSSSRITLEAKLVVRNSTGRIRGVAGSDLLKTDLLSPVNTAATL